MFKHIFTYELKYWFKKPVFYIYLFVFAFLGFVSMSGSAGLFDEPTTNTKIIRLVNSPFEINYVLQYLGKFLLFLLPAIIGSTVYKDYKNQIHSILYSFPIKKSDYLFGKFFSSLLLVSIIVIAAGIGMIIAESLPGLHENKIGVFNINAYLQVFSVYILPNLLFYGAIVFAVVTYFRNIYAGFVILIILFFLQNISENIFNDFFIALLDPFGQNSVMFETKYWTLDDKNFKLIPVLGTILYNRLFWLTISILMFGFVYKKFSFSEQPISSFLKKKKNDVPTKTKNGSIINFKLPEISYNYTNKQQLKNSWLLSKIYFNSIAKSWMFYIIVAFGILAVLFGIGKITNNSEMIILPVTHVVLTVPAFFFISIIMLLTFIYSGMLVQRDNTSNMNQLVDVTPISNFALLISKTIAILKMQALLLLIMMLSGIMIQIYNNYYDFEIGVYLFNLFLIQFIGLIIWAFTSIFIHSLLRNTYLGIFILILCWLGISGIKEVGINTKLLLFNFSEPMQYSDLNEYANQLLPFFLIKSYWLFFAIILLISTYLLWNRGLTQSFKERMFLGKLNLVGSLKIILSIVLTVFITLGFIINSEENKNTELSSKLRNKNFNEFKIGFAKYAKIKNQPRVSDIDLNIQIYPNSNDLIINGNYILINKSKKPIDTLLIKTGFDEITEITLNRDSKIIQEDTYVNFKVLKIKEVLKPNDSLKLSFLIKNTQNTLFENNSNVLNNGTFFKNNILPRIGYFLNSSNKHPKDSLAKNKHYYSQDSDAISLKTIISTSNDQTAIAPGYLKRQWTENKRNYFEYKTDSKIKNSLSFSSGKFNKISERFNGIDLEIFHHKSHVQNLSKMKEGLKNALNYNTKHFGPYQFTEARIIEFPITEGSYASVMANSIPTSEMRFITNNSKETIDLSFYTIAHELTHQWWGNQVVPADAFGAVMLSESITEYISLNIYEEKFGTKKALQFLNMQRGRYLKGRTRETGVEPPLFLVKGDQQYLAYGKGTLAFYTLSHYLGKEKLHNILKHFLNDFKDKRVPYPTSIDLLKRIRNNTPDSLQYLIKDLFETVTFYETSIQSGKLKFKKNKKYNIEVDFIISKHRNNFENEKLPLNDYIEFGFYDENEKLISLETIKITEVKNRTTFCVNKKPFKVIIDPNLLLIEKNVEDNSIKL